MAAGQTQSLAGKVALVTGGSKGIGAGIVRRLASDGASVAFTYSSSEEKALQLAEEIESSGGKALSLKADSTSTKPARSKRRLNQQISKKFAGCVPGVQCNG